MNRLSVVLLSATLALSCASAGPPTRPNEREWSRITADYEALQDMRKALPGVPPGAPRKQQIEVLLDNHKRLEPAYLALLERTAEYFARTGDPRAAKLYAAEKIRLGDDYMNVLSRYERAIAMYQNALTVDPSNAQARDRIAAAESKRFIRMESFSAVRTGMKEDQVRRLLGLPREDWIKQVVQKSRVYSVWIYPRQDGGASAIYFDNGVVYHTNWNAAPAKGQSTGEGGK